MGLSSELKQRIGIWIGSSIALVAVSGFRVLGTGEVDDIVA
jgi:hypothetical protein